MTETLSAAMKRLSMARHHLHDLEHEIFAIYKTHTYLRWRVETKQGGKQLDYVVTELAEVPANLSFLISDCVHNLRACLDNLVYAMATGGKGKALNSAEAWRSAFPIGVTRNEFTDQLGKGAVLHVPPSGHALIEGLQPYHAGKNAEQHPLAILRKLSNFDKHRAVPLAFWNVTTYGVTGANVIMKPGKLELGAKFCTIELSTAEHGVQVNPMFRANIIVQDPALAGRPIELILDDIVRFIGQDVLRDFALSGMFPNATGGALTAATGIVHN